MKLQALMLILFDIALAVAVTSKYEKVSAIQTVDDTFRSSFMIKEFTVARRLQCFAECNKENSCFTLIYTEDGLNSSCAVFNRTVDPVVDLKVSAQLTSTVYLRQFLNDTETSLTTTTSDSALTTTDTTSTSTDKSTTTYATSVSLLAIATNTSTSLPSTTQTTTSATTPETSTTTTLVPLVYITGDAQTSYGVWGIEETCTNRDKVIGYQLQVDSFNALVDNTALNSIKLFCNQTGFVTSSMGTSGTWKTTQYCPTSHFMVGFKLRSQAYQGIFTDDTAANDLQMLCSDGTLLTVSGGAAGGTWGAMKNCSIGYICGIQTLVEPFVLINDNTALNNVKFTCCP